MCVRALRGPTIAVASVARPVPLSTICPLPRVPVMRLILVRHAKSAWDDPDLDDFDRPLARRGIEAAGADQEDPRGLEPLLPREADLGHDEVAAVAEDLALGELDLRDVAGNGRLVAVIVIVAIALVLWRLAKLLPERLRNWFGDRLGVRLGRSTALARLAHFTADLLEAEPGR